VELLCERIANTSIFDKHTHTANPGAEVDDVLPNTTTMSGDDRLALFRQMLDSYKWSRQSNQIDFHEMMIKANLPTIFPAEWDADYDRILRMFSLTEHCAEAFIVCPRRFGKTVAVAMFCAVYMFIVPDASIAIFSTAQRTSGKMMQAIYLFMQELPFFKEGKFIVKNSETIALYIHDNLRTMWCYPGKVAVCTFIVVWLFILWGVRGWERKICVWKI
jgi:hypothetical protein